MVQVQTLKQSLKVHCVVSEAAVTVHVVTMSSVIWGTAAAVTVSHCVPLLSLDVQRENYSSSVGCCQRLFVSCSVSRASWTETHFCWNKWMLLLESPPAFEQTLQWTVLCSRSDWHHKTQPVPHSWLDCDFFFGNKCSICAGGYVVVAVVVRD